MKDSLITAGLDLIVIIELIILSYRLNPSKKHIGTSKNWGISSRYAKRIITSDKGQKLTRVCLKTMIAISLWIIGTTSIMYLLNPKKVDACMIKHTGCPKTINVNYYDSQNGCSLSFK